MDPITISYEARLRYEEIMEETGIVRKQRQAPPLSVGLWRWISKAVTAAIQPPRTDRQQEPTPCHDHPVHAASRVK